MADTPDEPYGECPICKANDGFLTIGNKSWLVCEEHKTKWYAREDLFSHLLTESEERWEANRLLLLGYREVEPYYPEEAQMFDVSLSLSTEEDRLLKLALDPATSTSEGVAAFKQFGKSLRERNFKLDKEPTLSSTRRKSERE